MMLTRSDLEEGMGGGAKPYWEGQPMWPDDRYAKTQPDSGHGSAYHTCWKAGGCDPSETGETGGAGFPGSVTVAAPVDMQDGVAPGSGAQSTWGLLLLVLLALALMVTL